MNNNLYDKILDNVLLDKNKALKTFLRNTLNKTAQIFEYQNLPDTIPVRVLETMLQLNGNVFWYEAEGELYVFTGGMGGLPDAYYQPTEYVVANPALNLTKSLKIGEEGVLMRNDNEMVGLVPIIQKFGALMIEAEISFRLAIVNTRSTNIISAGDDRTMKSAQEYVRQLDEGRLSIIGESQLLDGVRVQPLSMNNNLNELRETYQFLQSKLYAELGLKLSHNMKREYLNAEETSIDDDTLLPLIDNMLLCRETAIEEINRMYGTDIKVALRGTWKLQSEEVERAIEVVELPLTDEGEDEDAEPTGNQETGTNGSEPDGAESEGTSSDEETNEEQQQEEDHEDGVQVEVNINIEQADEVDTHLEEKGEDEDESK